MRRIEERGAAAAFSVPAIFDAGEAGFVKRDGAGGAGAAPHFAFVKKGEDGENGDGRSDPPRGDPTLAEDEPGGDKEKPACGEAEIADACKQALRAFELGAASGEAGAVFFGRVHPVRLTSGMEEPWRIPVTDVLDLHSVPPRDAREVVEEYLSEARKLGLRELRIVHGRGIGVQREMVRRVLEGTAFVESFGDAPLEAGGWGATLVTLRR